jgi:hypothetical protein
MQGELANGNGNNEKALASRNLQGQFVQVISMGLEPMTP